jgi:CBS domain-containing protein
MQVKDVLGHKGKAVVTLGSSAKVAELLSVLAEHNIGAVVISDDGRVVSGIVSERDVVRALPGRGADLLSAPVTEIMTADVRTCRPEDQISALAQTMTERRFRHMPVVEDGALVGIVTIGDIVKQRIDELETAQDQLVGYINS